MKNKGLIEQIQNVKVYEKLIYDKLEQFFYDKTFNTKPKTMIEQIKELRVNIDGITQLCKELKPIKEPTIIDERVGLTLNSKEIEKTVDSLLLAKAWLGKIAGQLGNATPYVNDGKRKTVEDIEPAADVKQLRPEVPTDWVGYPTAWWQEATHIEKVDYLREGLKKIINNLWSIKEQLSEGTFNIFEEKSKAIKAAIASTNTYTYLSEARFWLGFELGRIRDNE